MQPSDVRRASAAATVTAAALGLDADQPVVLQSSNKLTLRLLPDDVLARVAPAAHQSAAFELDLARRLLRAGAPVVAPEPRVEPRVHARDGFEITFWTYHSPLTGTVQPADYAAALARLHAGMRELDVVTPPFTSRVDSALRLVTDPGLTPALGDADRELLDGILRRLGRRVAEHDTEQLLHGEPHPGNLLSTSEGLLFIDLETCCRGPIEFDLAHAPEEVAEHYPGVDCKLLRDCRTLALALVTTWRWDVDDQLPDGHRLGVEGVRQLGEVAGRGRR